MTTITANAGKQRCVAHIELSHFGLHPLIKSSFTVCNRHYSVPFRLNFVRFSHKSGVFLVPSRDYYPAARQIVPENT
jgi:hypothetical protein